jgi:hypothetical protein
VSSEAGGIIHLVRHARVNYVHPERWMNAAGVQRFEDGYNAAPIHDDSLPPPELVAIAAKADIVAASDMIRAIASVRRLDPTREAHVVPALREITLDTPAWMRLPLPIVVWDLFSHTLVSVRLLLSLDHEHIRRADEATNWLEQQAGATQRVVAVTHGGFRRLLDARLVRRGWSRAHTRKSYANWSVWSYTR